MSLLHNITLFDLVVYNDDVKRFLGADSFVLFLNKGVVKKRFGLNHNQMVEQKWISESWLIFIEWYKGGWKRFFLVRKSYLYRGIRKYTWSALRRILKYGNDRDDNTIHHSTVGYMKEKYGLDNTGWTFARQDLSYVWGVANDAFSVGQNGVRLILIYNPDLLKRIPIIEIYVLQQGVSSFKDALFGLIRIKFV